MKQKNQKIHKPKANPMRQEIENNIYNLVFKTTVTLLIPVIMFLYAEIRKANAEIQSFKIESVKTFTTKDDIRGLHSDIDRLKDDINNLKGDIKEIRKETDRLKDDIKDLKTLIISGLNKPRK